MHDIITRLEEIVDKALAMDRRGNSNEENEDYYNAL